MVILHAINVDVEIVGFICNVRLWMCHNKLLYTDVGSVKMFYLFDALLRGKILILYTQWLKQEMVLNMSVSEIHSN